MVVTTHEKLFSVAEVKMNKVYKNRGSGSCPPSPDISNYVWSRDKGICIYCGNPAQVLDHVIPWADNGPTISSNLVCCCNKCNIYKGKHPRGLDKLVRALFWLYTHGENTKWMEEFYPHVEITTIDSLYYGRDVKVKRPKPLREIKEKPFKQKPSIGRKTYRLSRKSHVVAFRLPREVYAILERRANKQGILVSDYLRRRVIYDTTRKHGNHRR